MVVLVLFVLVYWDTWTETLLMSLVTPVTLVKRLLVHFICHLFIYFPSWCDSFEQIWTLRSTTRDSSEEVVSVMAPVFRLHAGMPQNKRRSDLDSRKDLLPVFTFSLHDTSNRWEDRTLSSGVQRFSFPSKPTEKGIKFINSPTDSDALRLLSPLTRLVGSKHLWSRLFRLVRLKVVNQSLVWTEQRVRFQVNSVKEKQLNHETVTVDMSMISYIYAKNNLVTMVTGFSLIQQKEYFSSPSLKTVNTVTSLL